MGFKAKKHPVMKITGISNTSIQDKSSLLNIVVGVWWFEEILQHIVKKYNLHL